MALYPDDIQPGAAQVSFSSGPNIFTWVAIMLAAIAAAVSALKAWMPTAPPSAYIAGGEVLEAALAGQRRGSLVLLVVSLVALAFLARWRRCVIDFEAGVIRSQVLGAIGFGTRVIRFAELSRAETRSLHRDAVTLWGMTIRPLRGKPIRIGLFGMDWGARELAERLNAAIAHARGAAQAAPPGSGAVRSGAPG